MQIAVPGMEDVEHLELILSSSLFHLLQDAGKLAKRNDAVHAKIFGKAAHRAESRLAALPDRGQFLLALADADGCGLETACNVFHALDLFLDIARRAFNLDDQHGFRFAWITCLRERCRRPRWPACP